MSIILAKSFQRGLMDEVKLNRRERYKAEMSPYEYLKDLENIDFDSIGEGDRFYLQDCGIYNSEISEDEFALRLRINAGRISAKQLYLISKIIKEYDLEIILTARAQMQLHGLESDNVLQAWKELNENGVSTWQTFGDNVRNIVTDVYDGVGEYAHIEVYPYIEQMQEYILKKPRFVGLLPRRVSVGVSGNRANVSSFFANDLYFALAKKDGVEGFNVYIGGKNTELARSADIFLRPEQIVDYFIAVVEAFHKHGSRYARAKTRIFHWIDSAGMDKVKELILDEFKQESESEGELILEKAHFSKIQTLKDGSYSYRYHTNFARISSDEFIMIADFALKENAEIRLGIDHHVYILGLKSAEVPFENSIKTSTVSSCAGSEYCPFSYWSIKDETSYLPLDKVVKHNIHVGFSGCLKGCGKHQHADIGVVGLRTSMYGSLEKAARVFLGGEHTFGKAVAKQLFFLIPLDELEQFLNLVFQEYERSGYKDFESFSKEILNGYSSDFLSLWFLVKFTKEISASQRAIKLPKNEECGFEDKKALFEYEKSILKDNFSDLEFTKYIDNKLADGLSFLTKCLWKDLRKEDASAAHFALSSDASVTLPGAVR